MTTAENQSEDRLWDSSVLSNKSWIEIMEEEEREQEARNKGVSPLRRTLLSEQNSKIRLCNGVNVKTEIKIEPEEDEVAQDLGLGAPADQSKLPTVDGLPTFGKSLPSNCLPKTPLKKEPTEVFQEDISLTGHLDGFKLVSPSRKMYSKPAENSFKFRRSPTKKKREPETDQDVIARRQKQIDYGKNTMGYERYRQLVPKESRTKMHPRTPPLNLKFSRRAWDGLVKVWRQRLHFWDPPSEGGGNPDWFVILFLKVLITFFLHFLEN
uniref:SLBP_RNA_bind domain-containing protein n=1 Tax=Rhodnius prolixus TaxID=13249 RepID=T1HPA0_RHOPR